MEAASALFQEHEYDDVSLSAIARRSGMAKSNLYRYFETKEEIFLHLFESDLKEWVVALCAVLDEMDGCGDPAVVSAAVVQSARDRPRLGVLATLLAGVLEKRISVELAVRFKSSATVLMARLERSLSRALPSLGPGPCAFFLRCHHALWAGLWPMAHPSESLAEALKRPELSHMRVDFYPEFEAALTALLRGLLMAPPRERDSEMKNG